MKAWSLILVLLIGAIRAKGQTQFVRIYTTDHHDGTVSVMVENTGYVPITVRLDAYLVNMQSSPALPAYMVVFPGKSPRLIATYSTIYPKSYSYRNYPQSEIGIANDKGIDTTLVYGLPFRTESAWKVVPPKNVKGRRRNVPNEYFFDLPDDTPVCAAREGIVAQVKVDSSPNGTSMNFVTVFHDDGSYAWYQNLKQNKVLAKPGQHLAKGEIMAYANHSKKHPELWFILTNPTSRGPEPMPVKFERAGPYPPGK